MQFEIQASHLSQKFLVDAPNWLSALRQGLRKAGEDDSIRNLQCDILDENDLRVTDTKTGRIFSIKVLLPRDIAASAPVPSFNLGGDPSRTQAFGTAGNAATLMDFSPSSAMTAILASASASAGLAAPAPTSTIPDASFFDDGDSIEAQIRAVVESTRPAAPPPPPVAPPAPAVAPPAPVVAIPVAPPAPPAPVSHTLPVGGPAFEAPSAPKPEKGTDLAYPIASEPLSASPPPPPANKPSAAVSGGAALAASAVAGVAVAAASSVASAASAVASSALPKSAAASAPISAASAAPLATAVPVAASLAAAPASSKVSGAAQPPPPPVPAAATPASPKAAGVIAQPPPPPKTSGVVQPPPPPKSSAAIQPPPASPKSSAATQPPPAPASKPQPAPQAAAPQPPTQALPPTKAPAPKQETYIQTPNKPNAMAVSPNAVSLSDLATNTKYKPGMTTEILADAFMRAMEIYDYGEDRQAAMTFVVELAMSNVNASGGSVLLTDLNSPLQELWFEVAIGPSAAQLMNFRIPMGQGLVGFSAQEGVSLLVADVQQDPRFQSDIMRELGLTPGSVLCVPIQHQKRVLGAIQLYNQQGQRPFTQGELSIVNYLAHIAGEYLIRLV